MCLCVCENGVRFHFSNLSPVAPLPCRCPASARRAVDVAMSDFVFTLVMKSCQAVRSALANLIPPLEFDLHRWLCDSALHPHTILESIAMCGASFSDVCVCGWVGECFVSVCVCVCVSRLVCLLVCLCTSVCICLVCLNGFVDVRGFHEVIASRLHDFASMFASCHRLRS
jgi:hypothetical protein